MSWEIWLAGQERLRRLWQMARKGVGAHAYLLLGPEGEGEGPALALAQALNCSHPGENPCGSCSSCRRILVMEHPDVSIIRPDGASLKLDQVRALQKDVAGRPREGPWRVLIMAGADRLTAEAGAALLKTIEEPPPGTAFVLLAEHTQSVLPTILSRCQSVALRRLPPDKIAKGLADEGIAQDLIPVLAGLAQGWPGRARRLRDKGEELARGITLGRQTLEILGRMGVGERMKLAGTWDKMGSEVSFALEIFGLLWHDYWLGTLNSENGENSLEEKRLRKGLAVIATATRKLGGNANQRLVLEEMFLGL